MSSKQAELRRLMKLQRQKQKIPEPKVTGRAPKSILKKSTTTSPKASKATETNGLSSLMTGYSSDESSDERLLTAIAPRRPVAVKQSPASQPFSTLQNVSESVRSSPNLHSSDLTKKLNERDDLTKLNATRSKSKIDSAERNPNGKGDVDEKTWKEFQDLIGHDSAATHTIETSTSIASSQDDGEEMLASSTNEIEQASYEARIARLRLKMISSKKRKKTGNFDTSTFTPTLAFQDDAYVSPLDIIKGRREKKRNVKENKR